MRKGSLVILNSDSKDLVKYKGQKAVVINTYPHKAHINLVKVRLMSGECNLYALPSELLKRKDD